jgi:hypothetical protein
LGIAVREKKDCLKKHRTLLGICRKEMGVRGFGQVLEGSIM